MSSKKSKRAPRQARQQAVPEAREPVVAKSTVLNLPIILVTLLVFAALAGGAWWWHGRQVGGLSDDAFQQGVVLAARADETMSQVSEHVKQASQLELEAQSLEAEGRFGPALENRDLAEALRSEAETLSQDAAEDRQIAAEYYLQYCELRPNDSKGPIALAGVVEATGNLPAAVDWYAAAIRAVKSGEKNWPLEQDLKVRRAGLLLDWARAYQVEAERMDNSMFEASARARFRQAEEESFEAWEGTNESDSASSKAKRIYALAMFGRHELNQDDTDVMASRDRVTESLEKALEANSTDSQVAFALARVYRAEENPEADQVMNQVVDATELALQDTPSDDAVEAAADARLARFRYRVLYSLAGANADLQKALELKPDSERAHLMAGWHAIRTAESLPAEQPGNLLARREHLRRAKEHFQIARNMQTGNQMTYLGLAQAQRSLGEGQQAADTLRIGLKQSDRDSFELNAALLDLLLDERKLTAVEADQCLRGLDAAIASLRELLSNDARLQREARRDLLRARWCHLAGNLANEAGKDEEAASEFEDAILLLEQVLAGDGLRTTDPTQIKKAKGEQVRALLLVADSHVALARQSGSKKESGPALEHFRRAAETYDRASSILPDVRQFYRAAAGMYLNAGVSDLAVKRLQQAIAIEDSLESRFLLTRARLNQLRQADSLHRDVAAVQSELQELEKQVTASAAGQGWAVELLRAELNALQDSWNVPSEDTDRYAARDKELAVYRQLEIEYPNSKALRDALVDRYGSYQMSQDGSRAKLSGQLITALQGQRVELAQSSLDSLSALIGDDAQLCQYYRLSLQLLEWRVSEDARDELLKDGNQLELSINNKWPDWAAAQLLIGAWKQTTGDLVGAEAALQLAHRLEPNDLRAIEQLMQVRIRLGKIDEAESLMVAARQRFPSAQEVQTLESLLRRSAGDTSAAIEVLRQEISRRPNEVAPRVQLGELLFEAGELLEAERVLTEAALLAPDDPRALIALMQLYGETDRSDEARETLVSLMSRVELDGWQQAAVLAQGCEVLGQKEEAQKYRQTAIASCRAAVDQEPANSDLRLQLADLLLQSDDPTRLEQAKSEIQVVLKDKPDSREANRRLARVLLLRDEPDDRQQALRIYEQLAGADDRNASDDRYQLAVLYESLGDYASADKSFDVAIQSATLSADELAMQIARCLRTDQLEKADQLMARLEKLAPQNAGTVRLRAQLLQRQGRSEEIIPLLEQTERLLDKLAAGDPQKLAYNGQLLGDIYSSVGMHAQAEPYFAELAKTSPPAIVPYAACLAAQGKIDVALQVVEKAAETIDPASHIEAMTKVGMAGPLTDEQWQRVEPVLEAAKTDHADNADLLFQLATVYLVRDNMAEATRLLEQAAKAEPENVAILNNLASLLGEQDERATEALQCVERALELTDPSPQLLDTKGVILLHLDRPAESLELLRQAARGDATDPRIAFHLAAAHDRVGNADAAKSVFQRAIDAGLQPADLVFSKKEQIWLVDLNQKYGK